MVVIDIHDIVGPIDNISQAKSWEKIRKAMETIEEDTTIDFKNINVIEPWLHNEYLELLKNEKVHLIFYNQPEICNRSHFLCILSGNSCDRIHNIDTDDANSKTHKSIAEMRLQLSGRNYKAQFETPQSLDEFSTLNIREKFGKITNVNTITYINQAIYEINKETKHNKFRLILSDEEYPDQVLAAIAELIVEQNKNDITVIVSTNNETNIKQLKILIHNLSVGKLSIEDKLKLIQEVVNKNTPGILITYIKSKVLDPTGRTGGGEIASAKICIIEDIVESNTSYTKKVYKNGMLALEQRKIPALKMKVFSANNFIPHYQYSIENDWDEHTGLQAEDKTILISEIGFCDSFIGPRYHFILPRQDKPSENRTIYIGQDENGNNIKLDCTIPELMKYIFDEFNVAYDSKILNKAISDTHNEMEKIKKEMAESGQVNTIKEIGI